MSRTYLKNVRIVDGTGAPEGACYQQALQALYSLAWTIKMSKMGPSCPQNYTEYVMPPLEGLWELGENGRWGERESWKWTSLLRQPEFVTPQVLAWAKQELKRKKPEIVTQNVSLGFYEEGLCVQMLHIGPYSEEEKSLELLRAYIAQNGLQDRALHGRFHHEIYLSDPRRTKPQALKTILRHPVQVP